MVCKLDDLERALLAEVVERPDDELALNVYADWLLDQPDRPAQARGEHLKVQIALARASGTEEEKELRWQEHALWWEHGESWLGPLYDAVDHFVMDRGRLVLEVSPETFTARDPAVIADAPAWQRVTDLVFRDCDAGLLAFLGELPRPPLLAELAVPRNSLEHGELEILLEAGFWEGLQGLSLHGSGLGDADVVALAAWPGAASLRRLDLSRTGIGPDAIAALCRSEVLQGLQELRVDRYRVDPYWWGDDDAPRPLELLRQRFGWRIQLS